MHALSGWVPLSGPTGLHHKRFRLVWTPRQNVKRHSMVMPVMTLNHDQVARPATRSRRKPITLVRWHVCAGLV
eukprot:350770-Chlamydomonas_euryale.AAC.5